MNGHTISTASLDYDDGSWLVIESNTYGPFGNYVRVVGADEPEPEDGSEPKGYFGWTLSPSEAKALGRALLAAGEEAAGPEAPRRVLESRR